MVVYTFSEMVNSSVIFIIAGMMSLSNWLNINRS